MTYILIQAMNPKFINELSCELDASSKRAKNYLIEQWIENITISPIQLLSNFRQLVYRIGYDFTSDNSKKPDDYSYYALNDESFAKLEEEYAKLFPGANLQLKYTYDSPIDDTGDSPYQVEQNPIEKRIEKRIENYKEHRKPGNAQTCEHEYNLKSVEKDNKYFKCSKCGRERKVLLHQLLKTKNLIKKLNIIKPITLKCNEHQWVKNTSELDKRLDSFRCVLCNEIAIVPAAINDQKLKQIDVAVSNKLGNQYLSLCNDLECVFEFHMDEDLTVKGLLKYRKEFLKRVRMPSARVDSKNESLPQILETLLEYKFIDEITIPSHNPDNRLLKRIFIRKGETNSSLPV